MPLKSRSQERYLWANHPKIAKKFEEHTTKKQRESLPEKVKNANPKHKRSK